MKQLIIFLHILSVVICLTACKPSAPAASISNPPTESTAPSTEAPTVPTTEATVPPLVEGDLDWGKYAGKAFVHNEDLDVADSIVSRKIILYTDGTYYSNQSIYSSELPVGGPWSFEGNILSLFTTDINIDNEIEEHVSQFRYEDGVLTFIKGENDISTMQNIEDGTQYIFKGVIKEESST